MAIYHLSASIIKRSAGRNVTAAAAYRAGSKIEDLTTGIVHDYTHKQGVDYSEILSPVSSDAIGDEWLLDREQLWNKVEQVEKRKDAQLAREITIAIPAELDRASQIELVREYVRSNYVDRGMIADINLHHLDGKNPHAHILLTMRNLQTSPGGKVEFGLKNTDWNSKELLLAQRQSWEKVANKYLAASGLDARIDCRSLEEQGSPFIPQIHVGVHAMAMKRKGIATDRGEEFDRIEAENNDIRARLERIYEEESAPEPDEEDNKIKEKNHRLAELIIEAIKHNPYPRSEREAIRAKEGIGRSHAIFDSSHSIPFYSVTLNAKHNIEVRRYGARPKLFTFEQENNIWIKKTLYNKTALIGSVYHGEFLKQRIDTLVKDFNEDTVNNYYNKLQQVKLEDEKLQLKENELGKLIINLSEELQTKHFYIEPLDIHIGEHIILIYDRRFSPGASPFELTDDGHNNFGRAYIRNDIDNLITINYFTQIVTNYKNELKHKEDYNLEINVLNSSDSKSILDSPKTPLIKNWKTLATSGNPIEHLKAIEKISVEEKLQRLQNLSQVAKAVPVTETIEPIIKGKDFQLESSDRVEERLKEPEMIEPTPAIEKIETFVVEEDPIVEDGQPIKVVEIHQPQKPERTRRRPNRGGR